MPNWMSKNLTWNGLSVKRRYQLYVHDLKDNKTEMRSFNHFVLDRHPSIKVAPNAKTKTVIRIQRSVFKRKNQQ